MKKIYSKPLLLNETVTLEQIIALSKTDDPANPGGGLAKDRDDFTDDEDIEVLMMQQDAEENKAGNLW